MHFFGKEIIYNNLANDVSGAHSVHTEELVNKEESLLSIL
jgi:hypothetical protein